MYCWNDGGSNVMCGRDAAFHASPFNNATFTLQIGYIFILLSHLFICFLSFGSNGFNSSTHPVEYPICLCVSECMHSICSSGCICSVCTCTRSASI